jgi:hypothetical protein
MRGIALDILGHIPEMRAVPDQPIKVIPLPERTVPLFECIDSSGSEGFPRGHNILEIVFLGQGKEDMDVIRHDDEGVDQVAIRVEMQEGTTCDIHCRVSAQSALSVPCVEPVVDVC